MLSGGDAAGDGGDATAGAGSCSRVGGVGDRAVTWAADVEASEIKVVSGTGGRFLYRCNGRGGIRGGVLGETRDVGIGRDIDP